MNNIAREDCFSFLARLPGDVADLAIIDPPYNMGKGDWDLFRTDGDFFHFTERWIDGFLPKMKSTGSFYIFNNPFNSAYILQMLVARGGRLLVFADPAANITPIIYTIPLQLLAYHVALIKGTDVDKPRNLAKSVTVE